MATNQVDDDLPSYGEAVGILKQEMVYQFGLDARTIGPDILLNRPEVVAIFPPKQDDSDIRNSPSEVHQSLQHSPRTYDNQASASTTRHSENRPWSSSLRSTDSVCTWSSQNPVTEGQVASTPPEILLVDSVTERNVQEQQENGLATYCNDVSVTESSPAPAYDTIRHGTEITTADEQGQELILLPVELPQNIFTIPHHRTQINIDWSPPSNVDSFSHVSYRIQLLGKPPRYYLEEECVNYTLECFTTQLKVYRTGDLVSIDMFRMNVVNKDFIELRLRIRAEGTPVGVEGSIQPLTEGQWSNVFYLRITGKPPRGRPQLINSPSEVHQSRPRATRINNKQSSRARSSSPRIRHTQYSENRPSPSSSSSSSDSDVIHGAGISTAEGHELTLSPVTLPQNIFTIPHDRTQINIDWSPPSNVDSFSHVSYRIQLLGKPPRYYLEDECVNYTLECSTTKLKVFRIGDVVIIGNVQVDIVNKDFMEFRLRIRAEGTPVGAEGSMQPLIEGQWSNVFYLRITGKPPRDRHEMMQSPSEVPQSRPRATRISNKQSSRARSSSPRTRHTQYSENRPSSSSSSSSSSDSDVIHGAGISTAEGQERTLSPVKLPQNFFTIPYARTQINIAWSPPSNVRSFSDVSYRIQLLGKPPRYYLEDECVQYTHECSTTHLRVYRIWNIVQIGTIRLDVGNEGYVELRLRIRAEGIPVGLVNSRRPRTEGHWSDIFYIRIPGQKKSPSDL